jgi:hypothetical protein
MENIFFSFRFPFLIFRFPPLRCHQMIIYESCFVRSDAGMGRFFVLGLTPRATNMSPLQG